MGIEALKYKHIYLFTIHVFLLYAHGNPPCREDAHGDAPHRDDPHGNDGDGDNAVRRDANGDNAVRADADGNDAVRAEPDRNELPFVGVGLHGSASWRSIETLAILVGGARGGQKTACPSGGR